MSRIAKFDGSVIERARNIVANTEDVRELRKALSVVLVAVGGMSNDTAGKVLGVGVATIVRNQKVLRHGEIADGETQTHWGGRHRELLTVEEERRFLEPWAERAEAGGVLVVPPIHAAFEERVGHKVAAPTVYRLLARHGWRKVEPEPHHPKRNLEAQETFKKTGRSFWRRTVR